MDFGTIIYELSDRVATITLNRPDKLNAVNGVLVRELIAALGAADADDAVRAVIVTGAGRAFCAGADLSRGAESFVAPGSGAVTGPDGKPDYASEAMREIGGHLALALYNLRKPVIAAINGAAAGMGATMVLPMDIRICAEEARFGFVFARRGMVLETGASFFLPRIAGISKSLEWCMSGRMVPAAEALEHGLVTAVVPQERAACRSRPDRARDRRQRRAGLGRAGPADAVARARHGASDGRAPHREPRHVCPRARRRCRGRRQVVHGEAAAGLSRPRLAQYAGFLSVVGRAGLLLMNLSRRG